MNKKKKKNILIVYIASLVVITCFPSKKAILLKPDTIDSYMQIESPTKVFLLDASVILFPDGFTVKNDTVCGTGQRYWINYHDEKIIQHQMPLDSIAAMTYYELEHSAGEQVGSAIFGLYGGILAPLSIYCIICPKCCFGSCPTLYTYDGKDYQLEAELFSYCISRYFQETDLDRLSSKISKNGNYPIRLTNEALETHYINQLSLLTVYHPSGTQVFPSTKGGFITIRNSRKPSAVFNSLGENVLHMVSENDSHSYRSDTPIVEELSEDRNRDWLDLTLKAANGTKNVKLVLRLRNTLLGTVLFYDVVLASQGIHAVEWVEKMNNNPFYALQFNELYKTYAGIKVKVFQDGEWKQRSKIGDIGPIAWKEMAVDIPVEESDINPAGEIYVRLEFFPDNFMIDYIAYETEDDFEDSLIITEMSPKRIINDLGKNQSDISYSLQTDDSRFLITNPGESYYLDYEVQMHPEMEIAIFVRSKGYYTEWLRGDWITTKDSDYRFNLFEVDRTIARLKESWLENRELLENEFFKTRIPLKEEL